MTQRFKASIHKTTLPVCVMCCIALVVAGANLNIGDSKPGVNLDQEKSVESTHKNIKVLNGLRESQLFPVMNYMRGSLGVSCAYCHVYSGEDNWNFASDEKPTKQTARRMIQMVLDINKNNKEIFGSNSVSCFTCHRGNIRPSVLPTLPVPVPEGGAAGLIAPTNIVLPSPNEIV